VVIGRYVFGVGSILAQEAIVYMHAGLFMLAAAWTLSRNGHVRVDIFYREAPARARAWIDLAGSIVLLLPVAALLLWVSLPYVADAWAVLERSRETSGIPAVFLLKTLIPVFALQIGLQGLALAVRAADVLAGRALSVPDEELGL
jgi:TRAP-type mannitol/chloroaromatic compound transport system permease small subunit